MINYIVPCYNEILTIAQCLDSIYESVTDTGMESEIIVVDCGSSDGSLDILKKYSVQLYHIPTELRSYAKAINLGMTKARGYFVQIVDSDCVLIQGWMNQAIQYLEKNPEISAAAGKWIGNDQGSAVTKQRVERTTTSKNFLFQAMGGPHLFKRNTVIQYPMDESLGGSADVDQIIRIKCDGHKTVRLSIPMLYQLKQEETHFLRLMNTAFIRHGIGSGRGFRKAWGRSLQCIAYYHFAKKYHLFFGFIILLPVIALLLLSIGFFSLATKLFTLFGLLFAVFMLAAIYINGSLYYGVQMIILKYIAALGFFIGLMKK